MKRVVGLLVLISMIGCGGGSGSENTPYLVSINVAPIDVSISRGTTQQFSATGTYSDNSTRDLTSSVTWISTKEAAATISSEGLAPSVAAGSTTIKAASGNIIGRTTMMVRNLALESPFGFHPALVSKPGYDNSDYGDAKNIGVTWTRQGLYAFWFLVQPDLEVQDYEFALYDKQWSAVPADMKILANIDIAPQGSICERYCQSGSYMPIDVDKYALFVKAVVERYDGDGIGDMPGLANPIKYWQVGNEPSVLQKSDFAKFQDITYAAIKEACQDCTVLIGGVMGFMDKDDYISSFNTHYKPILDALAGNHVDVMDFHWFGNATGDYKGAKDAYNHIYSVLAAAGFPQIPIWITEMGSYSGDPAPVTTVDRPFQTERQQALDYFKRFVYPLSFGVKKIFSAFGLMEGLGYDGGYFDYTGLIYDGWDPAGGTQYDLGLGVKKLGYYTYKKMTEMLEGSDWDRIETIRDSDDVYIFAFMKNSKPIYVAWWDYFNDAAYAPGKTIQVSFSGLHGTSAVITEAVPKFATGAEVTDYSTAFNTSTLTISNGAVTLNLGDSPVFVEVLQ